MRKTRALKNRGSWCLLLIGGLLALCGCADKKDDSLFRIIDHIGRENVVSNPLKAMSGNIPENSTLAEVAGKYPLQDLGSSENPFLIKKKLHIGPVDLNSLAATPDSHFRIPVDIRAGSILDLAFGILRDNEVYEGKEADRRVTFRIVLETEKSGNEILRKTLILGPKKTLIFDVKKISLGAGGRHRAVLHLLTEGDTKALAFWFYPVIYRPNPAPNNVILISLDTLRADHLGCYGYTRPTSPSIDSLATDATVFLNTFASSPWTLPSHLSIMTSLHTMNHRVYSDDQTLHPAVPTLAEILKARGFYNVAFTGGGYVSGSYGFNRGFEHYHVSAAGGEKRGVEKLWSEASAWINDNRDKKFFVFLHTYQIHGPYDVPEPFGKLFADPGDEFASLDLKSLRVYHENRFKPLPEKLRRNIVNLYDSGIRYTDERLIKPLVEELRDLRLYDQTMIILTSDHGEEFYEHRSWTHAHSVYDGVIKVPLVIKFFNSKHAGVRVEDFARSVDILPTILDELKARHSEASFDGRSLVGILESGKGGSREARAFIADLGSHAEAKHIPMKVAISRGIYKFIFNERYSPEDLNYFLSPPPPLAEAELFDLSGDPGETMNLAGQRPELAREMARWLASHYGLKKDYRAGSAAVRKEVLEQLKSLGYL